MIAGQNIKYQPTTIVSPGGYMHGSITLNGNYCGTQPLPVMAVVAGYEEIIPPFAGASFRIYPNPTTGIFILEKTDTCPAGRIDIAVYSMQGEKLLSYDMTYERSHMFSLSGRPPGLYLIHFLTGSQAKTVKIIKQ